MSALFNKQDFLVFGFSHHRTPLTLLEKVSLKPDHLELALRDINKRQGVDSGLILSTCNRVELYVFGEPQLAESSCREFLSHWCKDSPEQLFDTVYLKSGKNALHHLFTVAASLDSLVPGEAQILGQVKETYSKLIDMGLTNPTMDRLMRKAISVAKRVRTETGVGSNSLSVAYIAVDLAQKIFGELKSTKVLLVGAGKMSEMAIKRLRKKNIDELIICNRSYQKALTLAKEFSSTAIPFESLTKYLEHVDIVITSTASSEPLITKQQLGPVMVARKNRPLFIIDIALPRNVEPSVGDIENVYLYDMEDLKSVVKQHLESRRQEVVRGEAVIEKEVEGFIQRLRQRQHDELIAKLQKSVEVIIEKEIGIFNQQLPTEMSDDQRQIFAKMKASLTAKIIHYPIKFLKDCPTEVQANLVKKLFGLERDEEESFDKDSSGHSRK